MCRPVRRRSVACCHCCDDALADFSSHGAAALIIPFCDQRSRQSEEVQRSTLKPVWLSALWVFIFSVSAKDVHSRPAEAVLLSLYFASCVLHWRGIQRWPDLRSTSSSDWRYSTRSQPLHRTRVRRRPSIRPDQTRRGETVALEL